VIRDQKAKRDFRFEIQNSKFKIPDSGIEIPE
jgi:hypothetical protein